MTRVKLIHDLRDFCREAVKDMILPVAVQRGDTASESRVPDVYMMRLPNSSAAQKLAPYIIVQFIDSSQKRTDSGVFYTATVRFIFCAYSKDEQDGAIILLNMMDRVQEKLLEAVQIGDNFVLDEEDGVEAVAYPDNTAPYFGGEMIGTFHIKPIRREFDFFGKENRQSGHRDGQHFGFG